MFLDTSAVIALARPEDEAHERAVEAARSIPAGSLVTHNYVVLEALSLIDRRFGRTAARAVSRELFAKVSTAWIDRPVHEAALEQFTGARSSRVSLVDLISFEFMKRAGLKRAFAFDADFGRAGFESVPG